MQHRWPRESLDIWMQNACADLHWHGDIPITQAHPVRTPDASYITSLRSGWFDYAADELRDQKLLSRSVRIAGKAAQLFGLDQLILVGNFPVSTTTWTERAQTELATACTDSLRVHPELFIGVRNLLAGTNSSLINTLRTRGFHALPARLVYEFDLRQGSSSKSSHLKRDLSALTKSTLATHIQSEISNPEASRIRELYQAIYIKKHSVLNAQYTTQFFLDMVQHQIMKVLMLKNTEGLLIAFAMLYQQDDTLTVPALGYDTNTDIEGLYRFLFAAIYQYTQTHRLLLNYSSGAGDFKRKRGGVPRMEYTLLHAPKAWQRHVLEWLERRTRLVQTDHLIRLGA